MSGFCVVTEDPKDMYDTACEALSSLGITKHD